MDSNGSIESVHINCVSVPLGGGYSLQWASWGRAASQGMFFGIFVLDRVSILSFFVLIRVSILSIFVLNRVSFLGQ